MRAVRARHDGFARNPWNETECGHHYARSLAAWGLLVAATGVSYDAAAGALGFAPDGDLHAFFSTGTGWGRITIDHSGLTLALDHGSLRLRSLTVRGRELLDSGGLTLHAGDTAQRPLGTEDPR